MSKISPPDSIAFDDCRIVEPISFLDELNGIIGNARDSDSMLAVVVLKVLGTERVSSKLGILAAEEMLRGCTMKIQHGLADRAAVFRIGSDKLAVVILEVRNEGHALLAAHKVQRLMSLPFIAANQKFRLSCAQGLSLYPSHGKNAVDLTRCAESALEEAQSSGAAIRVHSISNTKQQKHGWELEQQVERALSDDGLLVAFHPKVDLATQTVRGAEALLRVADSDISPEHFAETAEYMGRMVDLTSAILNAALRHACEWHKLGYPIGVSVNVSSSLVRSTECVDLVKDALKIWKVPRGTLTLEVTESTFLHDPDSCFRMLDILRNMGVRVSIDDFGTGYSSLSYFKHIPASELKIGRMFVTDMLRDGANARIVNAVINLAHAFAMDVVAVGVEDESTLEALRTLGCDLAQGHHLTPPLAPGDFVEWLQRQEESSNEMAAAS